MWTLVFALMAAVRHLAHSSLVAFLGLVALPWLIVSDFRCSVAVYQGADCAYSFCHVVCEVSNEVACACLSLVKNANTPSREHVPYAKLDFPTDAHNNPNGPYEDIITSRLRSKFTGSLNHR